MKNMENFTLWPVVSQFQEHFVCDSQTTRLFEIKETFICDKQHNERVLQGQGNDLFSARKILERKRVNLVNVLPVYRSNGPELRKYITSLPERRRNIKITRWKQRLWCVLAGNTVSTRTLRCDNGTGNLMIRFKTRESSLPRFYRFPDPLNEAITRLESIVERMAADSMSRVIRFSTSSLLSASSWRICQIASNNDTLRFSDD